MERRLNTIGLVLLCALSTAAFAHEGHDPVRDDAPQRDGAATPDHEVFARDGRVTSFFDGPFITHTTANFRLHSSHAGWAHEAGELLEYTHERFYEIWGDLAAPLNAQLTWVGFDERDLFHRYAQESDGVDMSWSDGYYSARTNRVVVVHPTSRRSGRASRGSRSDGEVLGQDGDEERGDDRPALVDPGQVTHEAAHQIAFNSGLQRRGVMYPLWVSEGLATNFETNPDGDFGPDVDNPNRRRQLLRAWHGGRMMPLEDLIIMARVPQAPGRSISEAYAQCWSFFQYLYQHHQPQLKQYLASLAQKEPGHRRDRTLRQEFFDAFGDLNAIEAGFHEFIRTEIARR